jgi:TRAP-type C4-dicarboxylate transport system permease small subunit
MDRLVLWVERVAGVCLLVVALTTFAAVVLRKFFNYAPPDYFDVARLLLGITIFWGISSACYRNGHIVVDLLWDFSPPRRRRWIDIVATTALLGFMVPFCWMFLTAVPETRAANILTYELRMPVWPWHFFAALGIVAATALTALRLWEVVRRTPDAHVPRH